MNRFVTALVFAALAVGFAQAEEPKECCKDKAACGKECKPGKEGAKHAKHGAKDGKECAKEAKECAKDGKQDKDCHPAPAAAKEKPKT